MTYPVAIMARINNKVVEVQAYVWVTFPDDKEVRFDIYVEGVLAYQSANLSRTLGYLTTLLHEGLKELIP